MATIVINVNTMPGEPSGLDGTITVTTEDPLSAVFINRTATPTTYLIRNVKVKVDLISSVKKSDGTVVQKPVENVEIENLQFYKANGLKTNSLNKKGNYYDNEETVTIGSFKRFDGNIEAKDYFGTYNKDTKNAYFYFTHVDFKVSYDTANGERGSITYRRETIAAAQRPKVELRLTAKPTFNLNSSSVGPYYTGLTPYAVDITDCLAQYGGDVVRSSLVIGGSIPEVFGSGDGTLSVMADVSNLSNDTEEFTPSVTVTDTRGLSTTKTLPTIEYKKYNKPTVLYLDAFRCDENGIRSEDGEKALLRIDYSFSQTVVSSMEKPEVMIDGIDHSDDVTWYENYNDTTGLSDEVIFPYMPSSTTIYTIYGKVDTYLHSDSKFIFDVKIVDSVGGESELYNSVLPSSKFTIDFLAGGKGIAFGKASTEEGFDCNMESKFRKSVSIMDDLKLSLDTTDPPDLTTVDGRIYKALKDLGWDSEIIE